MLIQFSFKNFRSFKDEAILDLTAHKATEFANQIVQQGGEKILPVAAIFGANASGKSNVHLAFRTMKEFVLRSFNFGGDDEAYQDARPMPFLFSEETESVETCFEVHFTIPGDETERVYNYGFCVDGEGVTEEWFNSKAKTARSYSSIFYRDKENLELDGLEESSRKNIETALERQALIASLGAKLKVEECKKIRDWCSLNRAMDFGNPMRNLVASRTLPKGFVNDIKVQEDVVRYLSSFDEGIKGFHIEKAIREGKEENSTLYRIWSLHEKEGSGAMVEIPLDAESAGTLKMFSLYEPMHQILQDGGVLFVDELNARLHPLLVRNVIQLFLNPEINKNHAQLVFTIHDTWHFSNRLLRRDEIWLTEKNAKGESVLYSLADFEDEDGKRIRKDEDYEKNYLLGKYGAIPTLKGLYHMVEDNSDGEERQNG